MAKTKQSSAASSGTIPPISKEKGEMLQVLKRIQDMRNATARDPNTTEILEEDMMKTDKQYADKNFQRGILFANKAAINGDRVSKKCLRQSMKDSVKVKREVILKVTKNDTKSIVASKISSPNLKKQSQNDNYEDYNKVKSNLKKNNDKSMKESEPNTFKTVKNGTRVVRETKKKTPIVTNNSYEVLSDDDEDMDKSVEPTPHIAPMNEDIASSLLKAIKDFEDNKGEQTVSEELEEMNISDDDNPNDDTEDDRSEFKQKSKMITPHKSPNFKNKNTVATKLKNDSEIPPQSYIRDDDNDNADISNEPKINQQTTINGDDHNPLLSQPIENSHSNSSDQLKPKSSFSKKKDNGWYQDSDEDDVIMDDDHDITNDFQDMTSDDDDLSFDTKMIMNESGRNEINIETPSEKPSGNSKGVIPNIEIDENLNDSRDYSTIKNNLTDKNSENIEENVSMNEKETYKSDSSNASMDNNEYITKQKKHNSRFRTYIQIEQDRPIKKSTHIRTVINGFLTNALLTDSTLLLLPLEKNDTTTAISHPTSTPTEKDDLDTFIKILKQNDRPLQKITKTTYTIRIESAQRFYPLKAPGTPLRKWLEKEQMYAKANNSTYMNTKNIFWLHGLFPAWTNRSDLEKELLGLLGNYVERTLDFSTKPVRINHNGKFFECYPLTVSAPSHLAEKMTHQMMEKLQTPLNSTEYPILNNSKVIPIQRNEVFDDKFLSTAIGTHNNIIESLSFIEITFPPNFNLNDEMESNEGTINKRGILQSIEIENDPIFYNIQRGIRNNKVKFIYEPEKEKYVKILQEDPKKFFRENLEWDQFENLQIDTMPTTNMKSVSPIPNSTKNYAHEFFNKISQKAIQFTPNRTFAQIVKNKEPINPEGSQLPNLTETSNLRSHLENLIAKETRKADNKLGTMETTIANTVSNISSLKAHFQTMIESEREKTTEKINNVQNSLDITSNKVSQMSQKIAEVGSSIDAKFNELHKTINTMAKYIEIKTTNQEEQIKELKKHNQIDIYNSTSPNIHPSPHMVVGKTL